MYTMLHRDQIRQAVKNEKSNCCVKFLMRYTNKREGGALSITTLVTV